MMLVAAMKYRVSNSKGLGWREREIDKTTWDEGVAEIGPLSFEALCFILSFTYLIAFAQI